MWLARQFAARRELKRLASEVKFWREKALASEKKLEAANNLLLERDFLWSDRFLTSTVKTFAISDEANHKTYQKSVEFEQENKKQNESDLKMYLQERKKQLVEDALDAGLTTDAADVRYKLLEDSFIEDYQSAQGFN